MHVDGARACQYTRNEAVPAISLASAQKIWRYAHVSDAEIAQTLKHNASRIPIAQVDAALAQIRGGNNRTFVMPNAHVKPLSKKVLAVASLLLSPVAACALCAIANVTTQSATLRVRREAVFNHDQSTLSPLSIPASSPAPPADLSFDALPAFWIDSIDWRVFDEAAFFSACGVRNLSVPIGRSCRVRAIYECLAPGLAADALPLDIGASDPDKVKLFVRHVMEQISPYEALRAPIDPAFSQGLFTRWFLQFIAMPGSNVNTARYVFPLRKSLLRLTHPASADRRKCDDGTDALVVLPRIGILKNELRRQYFQIYSHRDSGLVWRWAFDGMCQLFESTLARNDLPETFRYGSLAWVLLSIGIDLAGDAQVNMRPQELISLAMAVDLFSASFADAAEYQTIRQSAMYAILHMAHAYGKIDLRDTLGETQLEIAFALFQSQLLMEMERPTLLEALVAGLPMRHDIAADMLRERGFSHPERRFIFYPYSVYGQGLVINYPTMSCRLSPGSEYTLVKTFMMDCLDSLKSSHSLIRAEHNLLQISRLKHTELTARFEKIFDIGMQRLVHQIMLPALQDMLELMDDEDEKFWRCGQWEVRIPSAMIDIEGRSMRSSGASDVARSSHAVIMHEAKDSVLIRLTLAPGQQARTYWVTLEPFELRRYESSDRALLGGSISRFFKLLKPSDKMLRLNRHTDPTYADYTAANSDGTLLQTISEQLLRNRVADWRETARETTKPEAFKADLLEMLLNFIPLRACIKAMQADQSDDATLYCTLDALSFMPVAKASITMSRAVFRVSPRMTKDQISNMVRAFMLRSVKHGDTKSIAAVLQLGKPAADFAMQGVRLVDPGFKLVHGLSALSFRLSATAAQHLIWKIKGFTALQRIAKTLQIAAQQALRFYPDGNLWRAKPDAITLAHGQRSIVYEDENYRVFTIGTVDNVLVISRGDGFSLVNPQSGFGYGPSLRRSAIVGHLELAARVNRNRDVAHRTAWFNDIQRRYGSLCRVKRGADLQIDACRPVRDLRFGKYGYSAHSPVLQLSYQFRLTDAQISRSYFDAWAGPDVSDQVDRLRAVNLADIGYATFYEAASGPVDLVGETQFAQEFDALRLPSIIYGHIAHLPQSASRSGADYIVFSLDHFDAEIGLMIRHTRSVPFATYQEGNGVVVGIVYCDARSAYRFSVNPLQIPLANADLAITLLPADRDELRKFEAFQRLLAVDQQHDNSLVANAVKLADETPLVQEKFTAVLERSKQVLDAAISALQTQTVLVMRIFSKIIGTQPDGKKLELLFNTIPDYLKKMRQSMDYLQKQSPYVIGFFNGVNSAGDLRMVANTFRNSMVDQISFRHINKPLITFDRAYFLDRALVQDEHAANLIHELFHALFGARDTMAPTLKQAVYADTDGDGKILLAAIEAAAALTGSHPESHAPTLEHLTMLLAYLFDQKTKDIVLRYLALSGGYKRV